LVSDHAIEFTKPRWSQTRQPIDECVTLGEGFQRIILLGCMGIECNDIIKDSDKCPQNTRFHLKSKCILPSYMRRAWSLSMAKNKCLHAIIWPRFYA
jgi:hypothetical protein